MIINYDRFSGDAEKMIQSLMESTQMALDNLERQLASKVTVTIEDSKDEADPTPEPMPYEETDPTVPAWAKQPSKPTYTAEEVGALPSDTALFSGNYNDLTNKPTIPTVPTNVGAFTNDVGYLTEHQDISGKQDTITDLAAIRDGASKGATAIQKVKTINNQSIVGEGNITISGGGGTVPTNLSEFTDDLGSSPVHTHSQYLTEHQSLDNVVKRTGDQKMSGSLTVEGHNQEIGYSSSSGGSKSVASGASFSDLTSFTLSKGTWVLVGSAYGSLASAKRLGSVWALDYGSGAENYLASRNIVSSGASGYHSTQSVLIIRNTATVTAYFRAFHTNGSALSLDWAWRLVRIA